MIRNSVFVLWIALTVVQVYSSEYEIESNCPETISKDAWNTIQSHLLPENHPIKGKLDKIFSKPEVNKNGKTLIKAGFRFFPVRTFHNAVVARHPKLKGYLIKTFTDEQPYRNEWSNWLDRIRGAERISRMIADFGYEKKFKAPKKWIYMNPYNLEKGEGRLFILVVEDMKLEAPIDNEMLWKKKIKKNVLHSLYVLMENLGLLDSVYIDNIPFSRDGKIAFIDTEHTLKWPVPYYKLNERLSKKNREYWMGMTAQSYLYP